MLFEILSICKGGGYRYCRTSPPHPKANSNGLYPLHRVVAENKLGRLLEPGEVVHHRDEDKTNDSPENLEPKTQADHARDHAKVVPEIICTCPCGKAFALKPNQFRLRKKRSQNGIICCSHSCATRITKPAPTTCKCGNQKRKGYWNCNRCHAANARDYKKKRREAKLRDGESNTFTSGL